MSKHDQNHQATFNRTVAKVDKFLADAAKGTKVIGAHS
jgi:hypothetical protein